MDRTKIRVFNKRSGVQDVLGPGLRTVIWTQGCNRRCKNCESPETRALDGGKEWETGVLGTWVGMNSDEGLTISGGEPFLQPAAVCDVIKTARKYKPDLGVIVYTGNTYEQLIEMHSEEVDELLANIDLLIDGEYIDELNDNKAFRGSSNQRAIMLTDKYKDITEVFGVEERKHQLFNLVDGIMLVGMLPKKQESNPDSDNQEE